MSPTYRCLWDAECSKPVDVDDERVRKCALARVVRQAAPLLLVHVGAAATVRPGQQERAGGPDELCRAARRLVRGARRWREPRARHASEGRDETLAQSLSRRAPGRHMHAFEYWANGSVVVKLMSASPHEMAFCISATTESTGCATTLASSGDEGS